MSHYGNGKQDEVFSKKIKAGKRTYFFDVKATKNNDYFLVITESKRQFEDGNYVKHKIFVYKEDFNKFVTCLEETVNHIKNELLPHYDFENPETHRDYHENE